MQFKTVALPATELTVKKNDMYTLDTANKVLAPIGKRIQEEAKGGWTLHSCVTIPATIKRKKGIFEILLGWLPVIGDLIKGNKPDYITPEYYVVIFQREA